MMPYDRVQLKQAAKQAMKGQRPHPMLITLLFTILVNLGSRLVNWVLGAASGFNQLSELYLEGVYQYQDPEWAIQYALMSFGLPRLVLAVLVGGVVASVITFLWASLMGVGYRNFCLGMVRGQQPQTSALFSALPQCPGVLLTQFLVGLFEFLWSLLFAAGYLIVVVAAALIDIPALTVLLILAGIAAMVLGAIWVTMRYALVDFLIADQGLTGMDAIRESKRLMRGNTGRLFTLNLSFIGWYLLAYVILMAGIAIGLTLFGSALAFDGSVELIAGSLLGLFGIFIVAVIALSVFSLWLTPYITGAQALFYDWLRGMDSPRLNGGFGPGRDGWGQPHDDTRNSGIGPQDGGDRPKPPQSPKDDPWE